MLRRFFLTPCCRAWMCAGCRLDFAKTVQTECNEACFKLLRCSLSSAKIYKNESLCKKNMFFSSFSVFYLQDGLILFRGGRADYVGNQHVFIYLFIAVR